MVFIDFETRSHCDLETAGAWRYSRHPSTEVVVVSWADGEEDPHVWYPDPFCPEDVPASLLRLVQEDRVWCAHNAFFERAMWTNVLWAQFPTLVCPTAWADSQAAAYQLALPGSLEGSSAVLFPNAQNAQKDKDGAALMRKMCTPGPQGYRWTTDDAARLGAYCRQDVRATRNIINAIGDGRDFGEDLIIDLDYKINRRGFAIDVPLAAAAYRMANALQDAAKAEISRLTSGAVTSTQQHAKVKKWTGLTSSTKESVAKALDKMAPDDPRRPVVQLVADSNRSSVAKFAAALSSRNAEDGDRIYGALQYHGTTTGRWIGKGFQPQNLPRGQYPFNKATTEREAAITAVLHGDVDALRTMGNPLDILSSLCRAVVVPADGYRFVAADFSSIEARGALWLAGENEACEFMRNGGPLYESMAADIFRVPLAAVTPSQRQIGKSAVLGCGYGMGARKFGDQYNVPPALASKAVNGYREKFAKVPALWRTLERLFRAADGVPGPKGVYVTKHRDGRRRQIHLPSGRILTYWDVDSTGERLTYCTMYKGNWTRVDSWGGTLTENVVSGIAADLLRAAMLRADNVADPWNIVLTVHDEIICEQPTEDQRTADDLATLMSDLSDVPWAGGFPLAAEGWEGMRFQK